MKQDSWPKIIMLRSVPSLMVGVLSGLAHFFDSSILYTMAVTLAMHTVLLCLADLKREEWEDEE